MIKYRKELPEDVPGINQLHQKAFGASEPIPALTEDLRHQVGVYPTVSLVAVDKSNNVAGHVMISHAWLDAPSSLVDVMVLSPLGVDPAFQNRGIGTTLLEMAVDAARDLGAPLLFLEGDHRYYGPRGFQAAEPLGMHRPSLRIPQAAFQLVQLETCTPDMSGTLVYREPFWRHDCVGLR